MKSGQSGINRDTAQGTRLAREGVRACKYILLILGDTKIKNTREELHKYHKYASIMSLAKLGSKDDNITLLYLFL